MGEEDWKHGKQVNHDLDDFSHLEHDSNQKLHGLEEAVHAESKMEKYLSGEMQKVQTKKDKFDARLRLVNGTKTKIYDDQAELESELKAETKKVKGSIQQIQNGPSGHPNARLMKAEARSHQQDHEIQADHGKMSSQQGNVSKVDDESETHKVNSEKLAEFTDYLDSQDKKMQDTSKLLKNTLYGMSAAFIFVFA